MQGGGEIRPPRHHVEVGNRVNAFCANICNQSEHSVILQRHCVLEKGLYKYIVCIVPSRSGSRTHAANCSNDRVPHCLMVSQLFLAFRQFFYSGFPRSIIFTVLVASKACWAPFLIIGKLSVCSDFRGMRQAWSA